MVELVGGGSYQRGLPRLVFTATGYDLCSTNCAIVSSACGMWSTCRAFTIKCSCGIPVNVRHFVEILLFMLVLSGCCVQAVFSQSIVWCKLLLQAVLEGKVIGLIV